MVCCSREELHCHLNMPIHVSIYSTLLLDMVMFKQQLAYYCGFAFCTLRMKLMGFLR
jgi:hypothetical protein